MQRIKNGKIIIGLFLFILVAGFSACGDSEAKKEHDNSTDSTAVHNNGNNTNNTLVEIDTVSYRHFTDEVKVVGVVKPYKVANIASETGGKLMKIVKDKGSYVHEDSIICILDNDVLKAQLDAAKADYELARINFEKQEKVFKENVTSEWQYEQAKYTLDIKRATYEQIKTRYEKTFIKAPFSGIVDIKYYEEGEVVMPGTPIVTLMNAYMVKIEAGIPEAYLQQIKRGNQVRVIFRDLEGLQFESRISYVGNSISPDNRTVPIEVLLNNKNKKIKPELNADIHIALQEYENVVVIPDNVIAKTDYGYAVFVEEDGVAKMRIVHILSRQNNEAAIDKGLEAGDHLITVGFQSLVDGETVTVVN